MRNAFCALSRARMECVQRFPIWRPRPPRIWCWTASERELCLRSIDVHYVSYDFLIFPHSLELNALKPFVDKTCIELFDTIIPPVTKKRWFRSKNHPHNESLIQDLSQTQKIKQVQQRIARLDRRLKQHRDLRPLRKFIQTTMSWLQSLLGNRNNLLQLWKKYEVLAGVQQSSTRTTVTSPQSLDFWSTKNSSRGVKHGPSEIQKRYYQARQMLKKARQEEHGPPPNDTLSDIEWKEHNIMLWDEFDTWRSTSTPLQELKENKFRSIGFWR